MKLMPLTTLRLVVTGGLLVGAFGLASAPARADLPPPADYVESCTVEHQSAAGKECVLCGEAYYAKPDACERHKAGGYEKSCRTRGASTWKEVWCRKATGAAAPTPSAAASAPVASTGAEPAPLASTAEPAKPPPVATEPTKAAPDNGSKHGCGACRVGGAKSGAGLASLAVALGLLGLSASRRRPRRGPTLPARVNSGQRYRKR